MKEGEELQHPLLNRSIETAQRRVEEHNFSIRKRTLEYDDVMNKQREVLYGFRNDIIRGENPRGIISDIIEEVVEERVAEYLPGDKPVDEWDTKGCCGGPTTRSRSGCAGSRSRTRLPKRCAN